MENKGGFRGFLGFFVVVGVIFLIVYMMNNNSTTRDVSYNVLDFKADVEKGIITDVGIFPSENVPMGEVRISFKGVDGQTVFFVSDINEIEEIVQGDSKLCEKYEVHAIKKDNLSSTMLLIGVIAIAVILIVFIMTSMSQARAMSGGSNSKILDFGKNRAIKIEPGDEGAKTFADVAGLHEEKEELAEVVDFLKAPEKFTSVGARIPKGMILVGPPGTGKTLLAKAVAGEAGVPFFSLSGSDFVEMFVGVGASRVRSLFSDAKKSAPCIVFIDEIDAVARRRGSGLGGGHDEREQTLNQLLVEMDGFSVNEGIIVMAATNRVDILDNAILRPGRFDRRIGVGRPDVRGREEILEVHSKGKPLSDDVDLKKVARSTVGFTGADLENLMNEAAIACAKEQRKFITFEDISKSFIKVGVGTEKRSRIVSERDKKITAYHESGHAILFHLLPEVGPVHMVSIIPTGEGAAGYTMPIDEKDDMFTTRNQMFQEIMVDLGGRIAESIIFDDITTGASQDIKQATRTARDMVTKFGFSDVIGMVNYADEEEVFVGRDYGHTSKAYSADTASNIDAEVKKIIDYCYDEAKRILDENMEILHKSAALLLERERITREEFEALFDAE
ncbi:MAG: ATP-dependent zinc metalloprotease FtsH [Lachnospiraceae bacterium]|nr:ATP-dependent zinc metalloprotease FtsH [Lachnospiraceae bacterium]